MKNLFKQLKKIALLSLIGLIGFSSTLNAARTDGLWQTGFTNGYITTINPLGYDLLINGSNHYLNFGSVTGTSGYGFRDNAGVMQFKNSGGSWANFGGGGSVTLQTNGVANGSQSLLNLKNGTNITITDDGVGGVTINSTGGGSSAWGSITGTLSSQTDLQTALNAKANVSGQVFTGAISATNLSGTNTGDQTSVTGNAGTATTLQTARNIQGVSFNGSANIDIINGTGFVKATGTTLSYDNSTYLTTSSAASTYQPLDSDLTTIAGLTATTDNFIQSKAGAWASRTIAQVKTDLGLTGTNSGDQTITLTGAVTGSGTGSFATTLANSIVGIANLSATGTPSSTTYLRGDNTWATVSGGGSPGGSDTYVQFNDASAFGGTADFLFNKTTKALTINGIKFSRGVNNVSENIAIGEFALTGANSGVGFNLAIGLTASQKNTSGSENLAVGYAALTDNLTGSFNTIFGHVAANTSLGSGNTIMGYDAFSVGTGSNNTVIGRQALNGAGSQSSNVAIGYFAGKYNTQSNRFIVNNQNRTDETGDIAGSLLYGVFNATPSSQTLTINAVTTNTYDLSVPDEVYDATAWNGSLEVPTKNAIRDKIESMGGGGSGDMVLASAQTNSGVKTFLDGTMGLRNVANTFTSFFTNTNTASRTYTLPDITGTITLNANTATITNKDLTSGTNTFPTFNQNTTGSAATLTTPRTIGIATGDVTSAGSAFDGSANNTNAYTLATVNSNVGSFGSATQVPTFTVNGKGLITAASNTSIAIAQSQVTNLVSDLALKAPLASPTFTGTVTVPAPSNDTDAATKLYVDTVAQGLSVKQSVLVATAAALPTNTYVSNVITITSVGILTVDGVNLVLNDRVLVKDEVAGLKNGIYKVTTAGTAGVAAILTRSTDMDVSNEFPGGFVFTESGTTNIAAGFVCTNSTPPTVGTTAITFTQFSGAGQITTDSTLTKTGNQLSRAAITGDITIATNSNSATVTKLNGTTLSGLATGLLKNTTGTGVPSIAAGSDINTTFGSQTANFVYAAPNGSAGNPTFRALVATDIPTLNQSTTGSAATLTTTRTIWGQNFNGSANVTGDITLGVSNITMTGSIAATGARATKVWATDIESTNMPTVGGTSLTSTFSPIAGSASIVTVGTITTGTWNATTIADGKIAAALTGKTYNGLSLTANATGFSVAGGTSSKTLTVSNTLTLAGTDSSTLNIGAGGTLGSAAFTASTAYQPIDADLTTISGLTATTDNILQSVGSAWASRTPTQVTSTLISFVGDSGAGGSKGLVPAPTAGDATKFLRGDATWGTPAGGGGSMSWSTLSADATVTMSANNGYMASTGFLGTTTLTLPTTCAVGDKVAVVYSDGGVGTLKIAQNASQSIAISTGNGLTSTTVGTSGYFTVTSSATSLELVCVTANTTYRLTNMTGTGGSTDGGVFFSGIGFSTQDGSGKVVTENGTNTLTNKTFGSNILLSGNGTIDIGTTANALDDIFMSSGSIFNWNSGDVTLTHSSNKLDFVGATDGYQFDSKVAIGATPTSRLLLVSGDVSGGVATINRDNAVTTGALGTLVMKGTSSGDMTDGFGTAFSFAIQDNAGIENSIANIQAIRNGADNSGSLLLVTTNAGVTNTAIQMNPDKSSWFGGYISPLVDDTSALGTTTLKWSDLFLASGSVINLANGDVTMTHATDLLTIAGGGLTVAAGTTTITPIKFISGTLNTTAADGGLEMDGDAFYGTTDAGNRGYIPVKNCIIADATRTLPNDLNENAIFNSPANGRITLETGKYRMTGFINVGSMSATSGNASIDPLGAGTATVAAWLWHIVGVDGATGTAGTQTGSTMVTQQSPASAVTAGTGTAMSIRINGTFEVTAAGTMIPSIDLVTAAAGVVAIGSYFCVERIGSTTMTNVGQWD